MATSMQRGEVQQHYNRRTDVLDIALGDAVETTTVDTPSGFVVHYSVPDRRPVAVTVWEYCSRFGGEGRTLEIDADTPFEVFVAPIPACAVPPNMGPAADTLRAKRRA